MVLSKLKLNGLALLFLLIVLGCEGGKSRYNEYYDALSLINSEVDYKSYNYILFIPYRGCGGCVGTTINFLKKNETKDVLKVFYDYNSIKDIKIRMGDYLQSDVIIDDGNSFYTTLGPTLYPSIIEINNDKIIDLEILDPFNSQTFWPEFAQRGVNN